MTMNLRQKTHLAHARHHMFQLERISEIAHLNWAMDELALGMTNAAIRRLVDIRDRAAKRLKCEQSDVTDTLYELCAVPDHSAAIDETVGEIATAAMNAERAHLQAVRDARRDGEADNLGAH